MVSRIAVIAGSGNYPRLVIEGARKAGVKTVDVIGIKGSTDRATVKSADHVEWFSLGSIARGARWTAEQGYDGGVFAGQINPLSLFRGEFDEETRGWLRGLKVKSAHSLFQKLICYMEERGFRCFPASCYMDDNVPGVGCLTSRDLSEDERRDVERGVQVAHDVGVHDVGQTVMVKEGMVLAVEAFEGTNSAIKRGGRLGGRGGVVFKAAREGHDMRFDIPVVGLKTLKVMKKAGATALAFQAGRLILLDKEEVIAFANKHGIAIVGVDSGLPPAPLRP